MEVNPMLVELYVRIQTWLANVVNRTRDEKGAEAIEYIALAAASLIILFAIANFVKTGSGETIAESIATFVGDILASVATALVF